MFSQPNTHRDLLVECLSSSEILVNEAVTSSRKTEAAPTLAITATYYSSSLDFTSHTSNVPKIYCQLLSSTNQKRILHWMS